MRGDQLARQWRSIRAIEASPNGLTVTEIADSEETGFRTIDRDLEALQSAGFLLYTEKVDRGRRWAFIDTFKFKIPPPFTLIELMSLYFYKDLIRVLKGPPFYDSQDFVFKKKARRPSSWTCPNYRSRSGGIWEEIWRSTGAYMLCSLSRRIRL